MAESEGRFMAEQSFANHGKYFPAFHFFVIPVLAANLVRVLYVWGKSGFSLAGFLQVLVAFVLPLGFLSARAMALKVQDRVIRLEEQLRYDRLLPVDLKARIGEFSVDQCIALRFACDTELPQLARKVLDDKVTERKAIKKMVTNWKPDYLRA
jgi:uncharacterized membrane protein YciS (DUF1049 family)